MTKDIDALIINALQLRVDKLASALQKAIQLARIACDWNLEEVEINNEMVSVYALLDEWRPLFVASAAGALPYRDEYRAFRGRVEQIAGDFVPDHDRDAPAALEEMRAALQAALSR